MSSEETIAYHTPKFYEPLSSSSNETLKLSSSSYLDISSYENIYILFIKAFIACLTSGLGGLPIYLLGNKLNNELIAYCIIFAAGLMSGCSVVLFMEALQFDTFIATVGYFILGIILIHSINYLVPEIEGFSVGGTHGKNARQSLIIILSMMLHSLGEGISVGVSNYNAQNNNNYNNSNNDHNHNSQIGLLVIISLAIHNIPEGISICILLMSRGMSIKMSSLYAIISNLPQPLIAIPSYLFIDYFDDLVPLGFGLASGAMTYIVFTELIPEAKDKISTHKLVSSFCTSLGIIIAIAVCAN